MKTVAEHNSPLKAEMEKKGLHIIKRGNYTFFANREGEYQPYPNGYITGPATSNGNLYMSVQGPDGWAQQSGTLEEITKWAIEKGEEILSKVKG